MATSTETAFVPTIDCVRRSLDTITSLDTHQAAASYLGALNVATAVQRSVDLALNMTDFFDRFFRVSNDASANYPYVVIFGRNTPYLLNRNVAGSYAPSSLRAENPFHDVIETIRSGAHVTYSLRDNHHIVVRKRALKSALPIYALACFLYRDFGFSAQPHASDIVQAIEADFGFALSDAGGAIGSGVFHDDLGSYSAADFEEIVVE